MKIIKKISIAFLVILITISSLKISKVEASSVSFKASAGEVTVGTTVTLTATVTAGSWNLNISGNGISKSLVGQTDAASNKTATVSASFTPQAEGSYTFNLTGDVTDFDTEVNESISKTLTIKANAKQTTTSTPPQTGTTTTEKPKTTMPSETKVNNNKTETTKSSNNYLSSLAIVGEGGSLSPEFYRETYEYTVEYDETVNLYELTEIELEAKAEDNRATVKGVGKITLEEGENSIPITVTAENGTERIYTIKVEKPKKVEQSELRLQTLILNGIKKDGTYQTIDLELDPEKFEYDLQVPNEIKGISVNPTTENEDIIIEKEGNEDLEEGENKIEITLVSPSDKEIKTTYVLNIKREVAIHEEVKDDKMQMYIIAGAVGAVILFLIIILVVKHRKKMKLRNNEFGGFEFSEDENSEDELDYKMQSMQYVKPKEEPTVEDVELPKLEWKEEQKGIVEEAQEVEILEKKKKKSSGKRFL